MPRLQPRLAYLLLSLPLLLLIVGWELIGQSRPDLSTAYGKLFDVNVLWLNQGDEIKQEFVTSYPGLDQVDVFVKWQSGTPNKTAIIFSLRETCQAKKNLITQNVTQSNGEIDGRTFYSFSFPPLNESANQKYCFILKSDAPVDEKNLVGVLASDADIYAEGRAFYQQSTSTKTGSDNNQITPTPPNGLSAKYRLFLPIVLAATPIYDNIDVSFQLHYDGQRSETAEVFFARLVEHKPYFWGSRWFYIFLLITYVSGVTFFIGQVLYKSL